MSTRTLTDEALALALLGPGTIAEKAERAGVSKRTVFRRLGNAAFNQRLKALERMRRSRALKLLAASVAGEPAGQAG